MLLIFCSSAGKGELGGGGWQSVSLSDKGWGNFFWGPDESFSDSSLFLKMPRGRGVKKAFFKKVKNHLFFGCFFLRLLSSWKNIVGSTIEIY